MIQQGQNIDSTMMNSISVLSGGVFASSLVGIVLQSVLLAILSGVIGAVVSFFVTRFLKRKFPDNAHFKSKR